jgi:hypothetical protein
METCKSNMSKKIHHHTYHHLDNHSWFLHDLDEVVSHALWPQPSLRA